MNRDEKVMIACGILALTLSFAVIAYATPDYTRSDWGRWQDYDSDCHDTRAELLIARSLIPVTFNEEGCRVISGQWIDHYTGEVIEQASDIDVDHRVPVLYAHNAGGHAWSKTLKRVFYNDPSNLVLTRDTLNRQKGAKTPCEWTPDNVTRYVNAWRTIQRKYGLDGFICP